MRIPVGVLGLALWASALASEGEFYFGPGSPCSEDPDQSRSIIVSGQHGRTVYLEAPSLGTVDRGINGRDHDAVRRELLRFFSTLEDTIGPTDGLQLGNIRYGYHDAEGPSLGYLPPDPARADARPEEIPYGVRIYTTQTIHGIDVGRLTLHIEGDDVTYLRGIIVDPHQAEADPAGWKRKAVINQRARAALRDHEGAANGETLWLGKPRRKLQVADSEYRLAPWYIYDSSSATIHVNAITLETRVVADWRP